MRRVGRGRVLGGDPAVYPCAPAGLEGLPPESVAGRAHGRRRLAELAAGGPALEPLPGYDELLRIAQKRPDVRQASSDFDVVHAQAEVTQLIETAMQSPTSFNIQHWRFVVVRASMYAAGPV